MNAVVLFILGSSLPVRAVSLMRSRYTAFAIKAEDYLADTWHKSTRPSKIELKADQTLWLTLKILKTEAGEAADDGGMVEFEAWYAVDGRMGCQRRRVDLFAKTDAGSMLTALCNRVRHPIEE